MSPPSGKGWWRIDAVNYRQHTLNHIECPACRERSKAVTETGDLLKRRLFADVAQQYLDSRRGKIAVGTFQQYEQYLLPLLRFFGQLQLDQIDIGHIVSYQQERQAEIPPAPQPCLFESEDGRRSADPSDGSSRINHEINCILKQVLHRAGLWKTVGEFYEPLPSVKVSPGIALTLEEEEHFFNVARTQPRWMVAYCASLLSRMTSCNPKEIRYLRVRDIDLVSRTIAVNEGAKNDFRVRTLKLNDDATFAVKWLLGHYRRLMQRAQLAEALDHFILPFHPRLEGGASILTAR
jgi:hypothetical protein